MVHFKKSLIPLVVFLCLSTAASAIEPDGRLPFSVESALEGRIAGLLSMPASERPFSDSPMMIRGLFNGTSSVAPLVIVDGIPIYDWQNNFSSLAAINVADIEDIKVLKDASATAIFGSRAAGGVIIIKTKHGAKEQSSFNYNGSAGYQVNDGFITKHDVAISGNYSRTNYYFSGSYLENKTVIEGVDANRFSTKAAIDHKFTEAVRAGLDLSFSKIIDETPGETINLNTNLKRNLVSSYVEADILKNLLLRVRLGYDGNSLKDRSFYSSESEKGRDCNGLCTLSQYESAAWYNENTLTWSALDNKLHLMGGASFQGYNSFGDGQIVSDFTYEKLTYYNTRLASKTGAWSDKDSQKDMAFFAVADYTLGNLYFNASYRREGISFNEAEKQWDNFFSALAKWTPSDAFSAKVGAGRVGYLTADSIKTVSEVNAGASFNVFDGKLAASVDLYGRQNSAYGAEMSLDAVIIKTEEFNWTAYANMAYNKYSCDDIRNCFPSIFGGVGTNLKWNGLSFSALASAHESVYLKTMKCSYSFPRFTLFVAGNNLFAPLPGVNSIVGGINISLN